MSRHAHELCTLLVDDTYGELTSRIFETLLCYGRLSLPALIHHTQLSYHLIQHGLSVLIQQYLILWYTSPDERLTFYEANTAAAYSLVRSGKYIKAAEAQAGKFAGKVISYLLILGHARVSDLVQAYRGSHPKSAHDCQAPTFRPPGKLVSSSFSHADGTVEEPNATHESMHETLQTLLQIQLVSQVHISHFRSDADNRSEAEKAVPPTEEYRAKSKREQEAQREAAVKQKLMEWKCCTNGGDDEVDGSLREKKRPPQDAESQRIEKRRRIHSPVNQEVIGATREVYQPMMRGIGVLDGDLILRVNHVKFEILMRNDYLVDLAGRAISTRTAGVYAQLLRTLQPKAGSCLVEPEDSNDTDVEIDMNSLPQVSTAELVSAVKGSPALASSLSKSEEGQFDMAQFDSPKKRRKKEVDGKGKAAVKSAPDPKENDAEEDDISDLSSDSEEVDGEVDVDQKALHGNFHDSRSHTIRNHLLVLAMHPLSFLRHLPKTPILPERWTVDYRTLMKNVTHHVLLETITSRHGLPAARLTRLLFDKGKTDEKVLCSISLLAQKTMRSYLLPLHKAGMIGLQEVPRDSSRNPQRTNFLWFFDPNRCKSKLLDETYKTMARYLRRARVEAEKVKGTLEKSSRSDVIGREKEFLGVQELEALNVWREMDERIWGAVSRLDDLIACLRDT